MAALNRNSHLKKQIIYVLYNCDISQSTFGYLQTPIRVQCTFRSKVDCLLHIFAHFLHITPRFPAFPTCVNNAPNAHIAKPISHLLSYIRLFPVPSANFYMDFFSKIILLIRGSRIRVPAGAPKTSRYGVRFFVFSGQNPPPVGMGVKSCGE